MTRAIPLASRIITAIAAPNLALVPAMSVQIPVLNPILNNCVGHCPMNGPKISSSILLGFHELGIVGSGFQPAEGSLGSARVEIVPSPTLLSKVKIGEPPRQDSGDILLSG